MRVLPAHADMTVAHMRAGVDPGGARRLLGTELAVPGILTLIPANATALTIVAVPTAAAMDDSLVGPEVLVHVPRAHALRRRAAALLIAAIHPPRLLHQGRQRSSRTLRIGHREGSRVHNRYGGLGSGKAGDTTGRV